jgi:site-specific recombinase XerD
MALKNFRRHTSACKNLAPGKSRPADDARDCDCYIFSIGTLNGVRIRKRCGTNRWSKAESIRLAAEKRGYWIDITRGRRNEENDEETLNTGSAKKSIGKVIREYLDDKGAGSGGNLSKPTISKYRTILTKLEAFCEAHQPAAVSLDQITYKLLNEFRRTWTCGPQTAANNIARLRTFFKDCVKNGYVRENVAVGLEFPLNYSHTERLPFQTEEMAQILNSARTIEFDTQQPVTNFQAETFILLMRYSGMAISDAALFQKRELVGDEVRYKRKKRMRNAKSLLVVVPLPTSLIERFARLESAGLYDGKYYFCQGSTNLTSATDVWQERLSQIFDHAGIKDGTSHRFRHTFAMDLLEKDERIERVSKFLGHQRVSTTEKHYMHNSEGLRKSNTKGLRDLYAKEENEQPKAVNMTAVVLVKKTAAN